MRITMIALKFKLERRKAPPELCEKNSRICCYYYYYFYLFMLGNKLREREEKCQKLLYLLSIMHASGLNTNENNFVWLLRNEHKAFMY